MPQSSEVMPSRATRGPLVELSPAATAAVWAALVAVAVAGRAWQPAPHVTPLAAVAMAAGTLLPSAALAATVPVAALAIGNFFLPPYDNLPMALVVFAALSWPVVLGRVGLLGKPGRETRWLNVIGGALASSLVFFVTTNGAVWLFTDLYPRTAAGLLACFVAAIPWHRWMPVGDVAWSLAVFGLLAGVAAIGDRLAARRLVPVRIAKESRTTTTA